MDEYIELLNKDNKPNGQRCLKSDAHKHGYHHATVHVWLYTKDKQILIQKRHTTKNNFPNLWDISVAGHISYKELPINAAIRETQEEIGLILTSNDLKKIGTSNHKHIHSKDFIDHELHHVYIGILSLKIEELKIQESEVAAIKLISLENLKSEVKKNNTQYVPHGKDYYDMVFTAIENKF